MTTAIRADSLINALDPSKVPGYVDLETGAVTLLPKASYSMQGSAAGGTSVEHDTFLNYIDPSKVAGYVDPETGVVNSGAKAFTIRGSAAGGLSTVYALDLSREPGFVNKEN